MMPTNEFKPLELEEWLNENEEQLNIEAAESGSDREMDYCPEAYAKIRYEQYLKDFEGNAVAIEAGNL